MRKINKLPRIIKIYRIDGFKVYAIFNNGAPRIIDFKSLFDQWNYANDDFRSKLLSKDVFQKITLKEGTICWPDLVQKTKLSNGMEFEVAFDLDPLVLYEASQPDTEAIKNLQFGHLIKAARKDAGLTQEELAKRSGTTKNYISRIENNQSDIEIGTLFKIIEVGLGKKLSIQIQ
ncbi:MAG TPA: helix-turn-helix transcriptional regulator [Saprospiraceae bacterium]|nr:helix-turn-helix transcriptional regulator [Saprospiraceae bacterium]HMQ81389.1 helix-turn-helix transcriptional regulator [Saprospiraceae bacterium]